MTCPELLCGVDIALLTAVVGYSHMVVVCNACCCVCRRIFQLRKWVCRHESQSWFCCSELLFWIIFILWMVTFVISLSEVVQDADNKCRDKK